MKAAIAELEAERAQLQTRLERLDTLLTGLRDYANGEGVAVKRRGPKAPRARRVGAPSSRGPKATPGKPSGSRSRRGPGGSTSKLSPQDWDRARAIAEREGAKAAAAAVGVSPERIRQVAKKRGWTIVKRKGGHQKSVTV